MLEKLWEHTRLIRFVEKIMGTHLSIRFFVLQPVVYLHEGPPNREAGFQGLLAPTPLFAGEDQ